MKPPVSVLILIFLLKAWSDSSTVAYKEVCVKPKPQVDNSTACIDWLTVLENTSKYFISYTKLHFIPGKYDLGKSLEVTNVTNLIMTITEFDVTKPEFTIRCVANNAATFISVINSTFVSIQNVKIKNYNVNNEGWHSSGGLVTIHFYNISSMIIVNITIQNSQGYGVFGRNLIGNSVLKGITISHVSQKNDLVNKTVGGLVLQYYGIIHSHSIVHSVLIENFTLHGIQETSNVNRSINAYNSSAIMIGFHQLNSLINVTIFNASISKLVLKSEPLVFILYNSSAKNYVAFHNSNFTKNVITGNVIIFIIIKASQGDHSAKDSGAYFELSYSRFNSNAAWAVFNVVQPHENSIIPLTFKMYSSVFANNEVIETFWSIRFMFNIIPHSVLTENCKFTSNIGFKLEYYNVNNLTMTGQNFFCNNSAKHSNCAILTPDSKTVMTFKGYSEFAYNKANYILELQQYVIIGENSILNISYNEPLTQTDHTALVYFKQQYSIYLCIFQFLSQQGYMDVDYLHSKDNFGLMFDNNKGYYSIVHGSQLNTCYWKKNSAFWLLTPGDVYKRFLHLDVHARNVISRQITTFKFVPVKMECPQIV